MPQHEVFQLALALPSECKREGLKAIRHLLGSLIVPTSHVKGSRVTVAHHHLLRLCLTPRALEEYGRPLPSGKWIGSK